MACVTIMASLHLPLPPYSPSWQCSQCLIEIEVRSYHSFAQNSRVASDLIQNEKQNFQNGLYRLYYRVFHDNLPLFPPLRSKYFWSHVLLSPLDLSTPPVTAVPRVFLKHARHPLASWPLGLWPGMFFLQRVTWLIPLPSKNLDSRPFSPQCTVPDYLFKITTTPISPLALHPLFLLLFHHSIYPLLQYYVFYLCNLQL